MQTTQKRQFNLIDPFFDMELDYKNDFVSYITAGIDSNVSVTPKNNNIRKRLKSQKFNVSSHRVIFYTASRCLDIYDSNDRLILGIELQSDGDNLNVISTM